MRTIDWVDGSIHLIDQTRLPHEVVVLEIRDLDTLIDAITRLAVRGAPALGVAGGFGVALLAAGGVDGGTDRGAAGGVDGGTDRARVKDGAAGALGRDAILDGAARLRAARPTAVNLAWGVDRALARLDDGPAAVLAEACTIRDEDIAACAAMAARGADLVQELVRERSGRERVRVMTICNTGALAAVERGTALGVVGELHARGVLEEVLPLETRPLLQGARLTAWELAQMGAPFRLLPDGAAASVLARGLADVVLIGADRIAANGDTANKIGSFALCLGARYAGVPALAIAPETTIDLATPDGSAIEIEERSAAEVTSFAGVRTAPEWTRTLNPAFDVTPAELLVAVVTDRRVIRLDRGERPSDPLPG